MRAVWTASLLAWDSPRLMRSAISARPLLTFSSSRGSPLRRKLFMFRRFSMIWLRTDSIVVLLSRAMPALLRADFATRPLTIFTIIKTQKMAKIRPKPAYSFFPIVIAKCLRSPQQRSLDRVCLKTFRALVGGAKFKFHDLGGFFGRRRKLPFLYSVLARLDEQRMPANHARGFHMAIRTDDHLDLHFARHVHAASEFRVDRRNPGLHLALGFVRRPGLGKRNAGKNNQRACCGRKLLPITESHRHVPFEE